MPNINNFTYGTRVQRLSDGLLGKVITVYPGRNGTGKLYVRWDSRERDFENSDKVTIIQEKKETKKEIIEALLKDLKIKGFLNEEKIKEFILKNKI